MRREQRVLKSLGVVLVLAGMALSSCESQPRGIKTATCKDGSKPGSDGRCAGGDQGGGFSGGGEFREPANMGDALTADSNDPSRNIPAAGGEPPAGTGAIGESPFPQGAGVTGPASAPIVLPPLSPEGKTAFLIVHPSNPAGLISAGFGAIVNDLRVKYESVVLSRVEGRQRLGLVVSMRWRAGALTCRLDPTRVDQEGMVVVGQCQ